MLAYIFMGVLGIFILYYSLRLLFMGFAKGKVKKIILVSDSPNRFSLFINAAFSAAIVLGTFLALMYIPFNSVGIGIITDRMLMIFAILVPVYMWYSEQQPLVITDTGIFTGLEFIKWHNVKDVRIAGERNGTCYVQIYSKKPMIPMHTYIKKHNEDQIVKIINIQFKKFNPNIDTASNVTLDDIRDMENAQELRLKEAEEMANKADENNEVKVEAVNKKKPNTKGERNKAKQA